jgi:hypothetical protein
MIKRGIETNISLFVSNPDCVQITSKIQVQLQRALDTEYA